MKENIQNFTRVVTLVKMAKNLQSVSSPLNVFTVSVVDRTNETI